MHDIQGPTLCDLFNHPPAPFHTRLEELAMACIKCWCLLNDNTEAFTTHKTTGHDQTVWSSKYIQMPSMKCRYNEEFVRKRQPRPLHSHHIVYVSIHLREKSIRLHAHVQPVYPATPHKLMNEAHHSTIHWLVFSLSVPDPPQEWAPNLFHGFHLSTSVLHVHVSPRACSEKQIMTATHLREHMEHSHSRNLCIHTFCWIAAHQWSRIEPQTCRSAQPADPTGHRNESVYISARGSPPCFGLSHCSVTLGLLLWIETILM